MGIYKMRHKRTFLKVLNPAKILPPIQVLYFRSGGAKILIRISLTANFCNSCNNLSPKPFVNVAPPDKTIFPKRFFRKSISVRLIASTIIWWIPGYSRPMSSGSKRISGARNRSFPIFHQSSVSLSSTVGVLGGGRKEICGGFSPSDDFHRVIHNPPISLALLCA